MSHLEYTSWYLDTAGGAPSINAALNDHASGGWELVSVAPVTSEVSGDTLVAIFKRAKHVSEPFITARD